MGEGATDPKGIFGTTVGLLQRFGPKRILEMPVSENAWTGIGVGAAMRGQRPLMIHQRVEFALLAMEQLVNNAAKSHYVSGGRHKVPLVVRMVIGRGWGQGPMHSQSLEGLFAQVPGLKVVMPSTAGDAKGLLIAAIADENPVLVIEHRWVHYASGPVDPSYTPLALDGPRRRHAGRDATVVSTSYMSLEALQAARALRAHGCGVDLFDLRVLRPLRLDAIVASVRQTGRLLTVDTGHSEFGIGAEVSSQVCTHAWSSLKSAPVRLGLPSHPTPSSASLAEAYYPRSPHIATAIGTLVGLPLATIEACAGGLKKERDGLPLDIPHPSFKGPF